MASAKYVLRGAHMGFGFPRHSSFYLDPIFGHFFGRIFAISYFFFWMPFWTEMFQGRGQKNMVSKHHSGPLQDARFWTIFFLLRKKVNRNGFFVAKKICFVKNWSEKWSKNCKILDHKISVFGEHFPNLLPKASRKGLFRVFWGAIRVARACV